MVAATTVGRWLIALWEATVTVSVRERVDRQRGQELVVTWLPTLEQLANVLNAVDWMAAPVSRADALYYILLFHRAYLGALDGSS